LKEEYARRLRLILNTELSAKNKMQAIGSLAVPVLRYAFGIINWHQEEIQKLDRKTKKKCQQSMDSITREQTLIAYMFPEKREEED
jgi:hypothetical protein